jgi:hypothetical protein
MYQLVLKPMPPRVRGLTSINTGGESSLWGLRKLYVQSRSTEAFCTQIGSDSGDSVRRGDDMHNCLATFWLYLKGVLKLGVRHTCVTKEQLWPLNVRFVGPSVTLRVRLKPLNFIPLEI